MSVKPFSLLIKPTSADCNLRCTYCFYLKKSELYSGSKIHRMSDEVLEKMISSYLATEQPVYTFGWQGGEPTLMGLEFFKKAIALQEKYGKGKIISNSLQTNGTLIDDEFARFLAKYKFLVGISVDGPAEIHDHYRNRADRSGTHEAVIRGMQCLERNYVEYNVLTLVNSANVSSGRQVYQYLCDMGIRYHQYIPCVEFDRDGSLLPFAITGEQWGQFLCDIFDEWIQKDTYRVSVRLFDALINFMVNGSYSVCHLAGDCCQYFVVEHNGDIYPCDFFVEEEKRIGNLFDTNWEDMQSSSKYHRFGRQKTEWNARCGKCEYLTYCSGDCLKHRVYSGNSPDNLSWLCEGWKSLYRHALPKLKELAESVIRNPNIMGARAALQNNRLFIDDKYERNEPCFCGSGKKYKKCHGA
jgi:uncharacterized protein